MTYIIDTLKQAFEYVENVPDDRDNVAHIDRDALVLALNQAITELESQQAQPEQAPTSELHSCPYAEEIHGNYAKVCDCDEEATRQCAQCI